MFRSAFWTIDISYSMGQRTRFYIVALFDKLVVSKFNQTLQFK